MKNNNFFEFLERYVTNEVILDVTMRIFVPPEGE